MPLATVADVAPQRSNLEQTLIDLNSALAGFDNTHYSGATPAIPTPVELTRLMASIGRVQGVITALATAHSHEDIANFSETVSELRDEIDNAQPIFVGHTAEWKRDIMRLAKKMEQQSSTYISKASGSWIRRKTRNGLNTIGLDEHRRDTTKKFLGRHKGVFIGAGAGVALLTALNLEGCTLSSGQMPPNRSQKPTSGEHHPINKRDRDGGKEYDENGTSFSVGGFLNASKTTFANGASPEAQAFQGVWNYIAEHCKDQKWGPGERYHFHSTPNKDLVDATHFDVNAYTGNNDTKVIEIIWQKEHGTEKKGPNIAVEQLNNGIWRFEMNTNGTVELTIVYSDGRPNNRIGFLSKIQFQERLEKIQGF